MITYSYIKIQRVDLYWLPCKRPSKELQGEPIFVLYFFSFKYSKFIHQFQRSLDKTICVKYNWKLRTNNNMFLVNYNLEYYHVDLPFWWPPHPEISWIFLRFPYFLDLSLKSLSNSWDISYINFLVLII